MVIGKKFTRGRAVHQGLASGEIKRAWLKVKLKAAHRSSWVTVMSGGGAEGEAPSGASSLPAFSLRCSLVFKTDPTRNAGESRDWSAEILPILHTDDILTRSSSISRFNDQTQQQIQITSEIFQSRSTIFILDSNFYTRLLNRIDWTYPPYRRLKIESSLRIFTVTHSHNFESFHRCSQHSFHRYFWSSFKIFDVSLSTILTFRHFHHCSLEFPDDAFQRFSSYRIRTFAEQPAKILRHFQQSLILPSVLNPCQSNPSGSTPYRALRSTECWLHSGDTFPSRKRMVPLCDVGRY